uniref:Uncharacterized protein n=1 Tax=Romanomermis culicivorax TaxID=13658 RepID=A0A915I001_ROMCU
QCEEIDKRQERPSKDDSTSDGRPSKDDSTSDRKTSNQTTSDAIPAKIQKSMDNLNLSDVSISESGKSGNSERTTPLSTEGKSIKGKKGFKKRSTVARALFTASQELMPPPATTNVQDQPTLDSTTFDLTLSDLTRTSNGTFKTGSAAIKGFKVSEAELVLNIVKESGLSDMEMLELDAQMCCSSPEFYCQLLL